MSFKWLFLYLFIAIMIVILGWYGETHLNNDETIKNQELSLNYENSVPEKCECVKGLKINGYS